MVSSGSLHDEGITIVNQKLHKSAWPWLFLSLVIVLLDQLSKLAVVHHFNAYTQIELLPVLNLILRYNPGAAFSFLGNMGGWQVYLLGAFSLIVIVGLAVWLIKASRYQYFLVIGLSLIIGGAIGNLIDRVRLNMVIDFIDFHIKTWHFATFNIADSAICVGAALLIIHLLFSSRKC